MSLESVVQSKFSVVCGFWCLVAEIGFVGCKATGDGSFFPSRRGYHSFSDC